MTVPAQLPAQPLTAPDNGWLVDLNTQQREHLIGALVDVFCGAKATTGLLTDIEGGVVRIFRDDYPHPIEYQVCGTRYARVPNSPHRPALARALVYQREWDAIRTGLLQADGNPIHQGDYDSARAAYAVGLVDVYDALLKEAAALRFKPASQKKENTAHE